MIPGLLTPGEPDPTVSELQAAARKQGLRLQFILEDEGPPPQTGDTAELQTLREVAASNKAAYIEAVKDNWETRAAVARVKQLHAEYFFGDDPTAYCAHCNQISAGWVPYPCPTLKALNGEESP